MTCRCGNPITEGTLCDRCKYYNSVFFPEPTIGFESKKDIALKAIHVKKMMKAGLFKMVIE